VIALHAPPTEPPPRGSAYVLRLYRGSESSGSIETRHIVRGSITLGRDPVSDWVISDPDKTVSRRHCELIVRADGIAISVSGVNGAFIHNEKIPAGIETLLHTPCVLTLGHFRLEVDRIETTAPVPDRSEEALDDDADSPGPEAPKVLQMASENRSLLEAFCDGAELDSSLLASEEPDEIMRRVGAIYRATIVAVSELMVERDRARSLYDLQRTKIGGIDNNVFKWASSQRLTIDLLLTAPAGFLSGPDAVQSSFKAIRRHFAASQVGMRNCLRALADMFSPHLVNRDVRLDQIGAEDTEAAIIQELAQRHAEVVKQLDDTNPPFLKDAFALAYEAADSALERSVS